MACHYLGGGGESIINLPVAATPSTMIAQAGPARNKPHRIPDRDRSRIISTPRNLHFATREV